jgi:hypothetical protein
VADSLSHLVFGALSRAAAEPSGLPLFAGKAGPGLLPKVAASKAVADRLLAEGLLAGPPESATLTAKGRNYLIEHANPRAVVEDFVRVLEARQGDVDQLLTAAQAMAEHLRGLRAAADAVLPKVLSAKLPTDALPELIVQKLQSAPPGHDCPLPDLYRQLPGPPSIGQFHDALRALHATGRAVLHPWTGPLYAMPEPALALLAGHEIMYYLAGSIIMRSEKCEVLN